MKWLLISLSESREVYELHNDNQKLLTLGFHPLTHSARIEHGGERRVFSIRREGFLKNRIVLRNEYGMRMGQLNPDKSISTGGNLELNGEVFTYTITPGKSASVQMTRAVSGDAPLVCEMPNEMPATLSGNPGPAHQFILMTMGWYMSLKVNAEALAL